MMMHALRIVAVTLAVGLMATACSSVRGTPEIRYYVLAVSTTNSVPLPGPVRIDAFSIDDPYATRQLAYRTSPYRLAYYNYHRWAGSPEGVVAAAVREYLKHGRKDVEGAPFEVGARVRRLEEVDADAGWSGALTIDFKVHRSGVLVLEHAYSETEPADDRNPEDVVAALSRALSAILHALAADLAELESDAP